LVSRRFTGIGAFMNVIELLKTDHDKVDKLFQKVKANPDGDNTDLFEQIKAELEVRTEVEETIFYPYLIENGDEELQKITREGIEEHHQAKIFLREISSLKEDSGKFDPKLQVLMEDIQHHVQEEEGEMFPMVEEQFDSDTLEKLGTEIEAAKSKLKKGASA
jgi:iron-sulfur cluster repair protein YtfE (RIC family)